MLTVKAHQIAITVEHLKRATTLEDRLLGLRTLIATNKIGRTYIRFVKKELVRARMEIWRLADVQRKEMLHTWAATIDARILEQEAAVEARKAARERKKKGNVPASEVAAAQASAEGAVTQAPDPNESPEDAWMRMIEENRKRFLGGKK
jgi:hypothetical protein